MSVSSLDPYLRGEGLLHRADARVKLALTIAFILTAALLPEGAWAGLILLGSLALSAALLAQIRLSVLLRRSLLALPFLLAALPALFTQTGQPLARLPLLGWAISQPGLERFLTVAGKSWLSVFTAALFTAVTPFPQILAALRAFRVPALLVALIGLMWRYLFVMIDTAGQLLCARDSRSGSTQTQGRHSGGSLAWRARVTGGMAGSLLLRSLERSERVYAAMLARGYDGEPRSMPLAPLRLAGWAALAFGLALLSLIGFLSWLFSGG